MPASNTKIKKICEWCGTRFEAQKISTKYCSHRCANLAYKKREREKNIKATEENTQNRIEELPIITIKDKEFLSFSEVGILLGITRQAVYKMVYKGYLQASKISSRLSFVKRSDIDEMLKRHPYEFRMPKDTLPIKEFYTTAEIMKKFNVSESWIFVMSKKNKIPKTFIQRHSTVVRLTGVKSMLMLIFPRRLQMQTLQNGTVCKKFRTNFK